MQPLVDATETDFLGEDKDDDDAESAGWKTTRYRFLGRGGPQLSGLFPGLPPEPPPDGGG
jgi:hypothetical protein